MLAVVATVSDPMYIGRIGSMKWNMIVGSMVLGATLCGQSFGGDLIHRLLGGRGVGASSSCCDTSVVDPSCGAEQAGCGAGPSCGAEMAGCGNGPSCGAEIAAPACDPCAGNGGIGGNIGPSCGVETAACRPVVVRTPVLDGLKGLKCKLAAAHANKMARLHAAKANLHAKLAAKHAALSAPACVTTAPSCGAEQAGCGNGPSCGAEIAAPACGLGNGPSCGAEIAACDPCAGNGGIAGGCDSGCGSKKRHGGLLGKLFAKKSASGCDTGACDSVPAGCTSCGSTPVAAPAATPAPVVDPHAYLNTNRGIIQASSTRVR